MDEKLRILLCADDENLGMLLRESLQAKGYAAELYPDGEAGYKAFLKNKYDLCVFCLLYTSDYVEHLRPDIVLERFVSQSPKELLIAPDWGLKNYEFNHRCLLYTSPLFYIPL